jgi:hypothetical protein
MTTTTQKLLQLAEMHEAKAKALRMAAAELNGHLTARAEQELPARLSKARKLRDAQRPEPDAIVSAARTISATPTTRERFRKTPPLQKRKWSREAHRARRLASARIIASLDTETPRAIKVPSILIAHGYIAKKGNGYVRTNKPFTV